MFVVSVVVIFWKFELFQRFYWLIAQGTCGTRFGGYLEKLYFDSYAYEWVLDLLCVTKFPEYLLLVQQF